MILTLTDFLVNVSFATSDEVYEMFENELADNVRDEILSGFEDSPEPVRAALNDLGNTFSIQSLIDY